MGRVASQLNSVLLLYDGQGMSLSFRAVLGSFCIPLFLQQQQQQPQEVAPPSACRWYLLYKCSPVGPWRSGLNTDWHQLPGGPGFENSSVLDST